ncbi:phospho-sugar mutase [Candidatus Methylacidithermus pantelleriae]|uniref:Phosphoglucomutase n=1 Tax=Candidatus Methylacidithermus pantelleriae TaxID=2744239 RepID=A0A8J2BK83_9BACT|nr:phospho-sugar mutase [Candidatus Methylacidithermus pantelleriae]CAF0692396.1 Phosphoglucomutase [Candidatus Methylacidithermus pantelleriae]
METKREKIIVLVQKAKESTGLFSSSWEHLWRFCHNPDLTSVELASLEELLLSEDWEELNHRFYKAPSFGTGGIRGRTIARRVTLAEKGTPDSFGCPEHPATGTAMMNHRTVRLATASLGMHLKECFPGKTIQVAIAHDTRHFSQSFAQEAAQVLSRMGIEVILFPEERSTPQLSFTIRWKQAQGGIVISASHNPPHDNGFKAYGPDGAQLVEPDAGAVVARFDRLANRLETPQWAESRGKISLLGRDGDLAFVEALSNVVLEPKLFESEAHKIQAVYTPLHGTGARIFPLLFEKWGVPLLLEPEQAIPDPRFPTVVSPNPEDPKAFERALRLARQTQADLVVASDPDADRMGVAVKTRQGDYELLTGNQIGSLLAFYRCDMLKRKGLLTERNASRAVLLKSFVTTDLIKAIAHDFGVPCIETLTGFKYMGAKLRRYEAEHGILYPQELSPDEKAGFQLSQGRFLILAAEESYGFLGGHYAHDKDSHGSALMLVESLLWARVHGQTLVEYLQGIYQRYGTYRERLITLPLEGPSGLEEVQTLLDSYRDTPPDRLASFTVKRVVDFQREDIYDQEGDLVPKEPMLVLELEGDRRIAIRPSGTEPKIKFYLFTRQASGSDVSLAIGRAEKELDALWQALQSENQKRLPQDSQSFGKVPSQAPNGSSRAF